MESEQLNNEAKINYLTYKYILKSKKNYMLKHVVY